MDKVSFNILDTTFAHDNYAVAGRESEYIVWDRSLTDLNKPTFYSHNVIPKITHNITKKDNSFGILFESKSIIPYVYSEIEKYINRFNIVFTHNSMFLENYENCRWIPGGGIWIGGSYGLGEIKIHEKTKLCSIVSSNKQMCPLHMLRIAMVNELKNNSNVDIFYNNWVPIYQTLENYMFSIIVENNIDKLYFTEKILNCFATGTIPIYFGCKNIATKFDINGIIVINSIDELLSIIPTLSCDLYYSKLSAIKNNFDNCLQYKSIEDYIYVNYFKN